MVVFSHHDEIVFEFASVGRSVGRLLPSSPTLIRIGFFLHQNYTKSCASAPRRRLLLRPRELDREDLLVRLLLLRSRPAEAERERPPVMEEPPRSFDRGRGRSSSPSSILWYSSPLWLPPAAAPRPLLPVRVRDPDRDRDDGRVLELDFLEREVDLGVPPDEAFFFRRRLLPISWNRTIAMAVATIAATNFVAELVPLLVEAEVVIEDEYPSSSPADCCAPSL